MAIGQSTDRPEVDGEAEVNRLLETTLEPFGQVNTRAWGNVISVEWLVD